MDFVYCYGGALGPALHILEDRKELSPVWPLIETNSAKDGVAKLKICMKWGLWRVESKTDVMAMSNFYMATSWI